jgi:MinD-like ATPase involved in chromosome partitioning or flagellar assembly
LAEIIIFAGGFGSGKSEIAINFALHRSDFTENIILADLDLVNPYFASRDVRDLLESRGIKLLAPAGALSYGDVPSIPAEIIGILRGNDEIIIDVAGDEVGSMVLGYLSRYIKERDYSFYLVLNPYRPFAQDIENVTELKKILENAAHLNFTGLISNPNLMDETNPGIIRSGHRIISDYSQALKLPVCYLTAERRFLDDLVNDYRQIIQPISLYLKPEWLQ